MELGGLSGAGRVISKLVTFADAVLAVAAFFLFWATNQLFGKLRK